MIVFLVGFVLRIILMPYTTFVTLQDYQKFVESFFVLGLNPIPFSTTWGPGIYLFYLPSYVPYMIANSFGFSQPFILNFVLKIPPLVGDVIAFYALYNLGLLISKSEKISLAVAAVYFLNPLIIDQSAIVGLFHPLAVAFTLLSFLYLLKKKILLSALFLSISTSMSFLPVFLVPVFLIHLRKEKNYFKRFIVMFLGSLSLIFSTYLSFVIPILQNFPSVFSDTMYKWFVGGFLGGPGGFLFFNLSNAPSLFGFMWKIGVGPVFANIVNGQVFLSLFIPLYSIVLILSMTRSPSPKLASLGLVAVLSIIVVSRPISYPDLLLYVLPFLMIGAYIFQGYPKYFPIVVSLLPMSVYFSYNPSYHLGNTFPVWLNLPAISSIYFSSSVTYFFFLIVCIALSLFAIIRLPKTEYPKSSSLDLQTDLRTPIQTEKLSKTSKRTKNLQKNPKTPKETKGPPNTPKKIENWHLLALLVLLSLYSILEILSLGYSLEDSGFRYVTLLIGVSFVLMLVYSNYTRRKKFSTYPYLFSSVTQKLAVIAYIGTLIAFLYLSSAYNFEYVVFLGVQVFIVGLILLVNRKSIISLNVTRLSLLFTVIYVISLFYVPSVSNLSDPFPLLTLFIYLFSWIYLQFVLEYTKDSVRPANPVETFQREGN